MIPAGSTSRSDRDVPRKSGARTRSFELRSTRKTFSAGETTREAIRGPSSLPGIFPRPHWLRIQSDSLPSPNDLDLLSQQRNHSPLGHPTGARRESPELRLGSEYPFWFPWEKEERAQLEREFRQVDR